jgi:hypothetical protein
MRKLLYTVAGAAALATASLANAAITIGGSGTTAGSTFSIAAPNNTTIPETVGFDTSSNTAGNYTSFFEFSNNLSGFYNFALTTSTFGATITLEQLMSGGGGTVLQTSSGPNLTTGTLTPGTTYRFSYTSTLPQGGGLVSGNASFYAAAVPEPATWALMLLGFGGIGMAMRRRRRPVLAQLA